MPIVKKYKAKVVSVLNPADNIYTIDFESVSGDFKYLPGQFLHLALDEYDPSSGWPESRCFSIRSSHMCSNVMITFSIKGEFTRQMAENLRPDRIVDIKLPYGELFQKPHSKENTVFIAGGTGITPFLSLFNNKSFAEYKRPVLYAGFRSASFNIYGSELELSKQINDSLIIKISIQDIDGILNIERIFNEMGKDSSYFISGPQLMISSFKKYLLDKKVEFRNILTDDWE